MYHDGTIRWGKPSPKKKKKESIPKKDVKEAARVPSAKRALGTWRVWGCGGGREPSLQRIVPGGTSSGSPWVYGHELNTAVFRDRPSDHV